MKICSKCRQEKELTEFSKNKSSKDGFHHRCKLCVRQYNKDNKEHNAKYNKLYYQINKDSIRAQKMDYYYANQEQMKERNKKWRDKNRPLIKEYQLRRLYELTPEQAGELYSQGCRFCGSKENLCIDHCHETGKVRGCLCQKHNFMLGYYEKIKREGLLDEFETYLRDSPC